MNEISVLIKETSEKSFILSTMGGHSEKMDINEIGTCFSLNTKSSSALFQTLQSPEMWDIHFCCL